MINVNGCRVAVALLVTLLFFAGVNAAGNDEQNSDVSGADESISGDDINRILALSDDRAYGEYLAGECAVCHSMQAVAGSNVPVIHGADAAHLVRALLEFRAGTRPNTTMGLVASALDDEEIAVLVHYLASTNQ